MADRVVLEEREDLVTRLEERPDPSGPGIERIVVVVVSA
jgi:hypothetical protein